MINDKEILSQLMLKMMYSKNNNFTVTFCKELYHNAQVLLMIGQDYTGAAADVISAIEANDVILDNSTTLKSNYSHLKINMLLLDEEFNTNDLLTLGVYGIMYRLLNNEKA